eukprot:scaffold6094_cov24-Tisochrysis_lutea.AAC.1
MALLLLPLLLLLAARGEVGSGGQGASCDTRSSTCTSVFVDRRPAHTCSESSTSDGCCSSLHPAALVGRHRYVILSLPKARLTVAVV